mmetsp:Transcript_19775/g.24939  ORF Transcript_19775/g.24939 Transcript_19775/m.24939 type:complete len:145 (+) Transcript_19775:193-627(+)
MCNTKLVEEVQKGESNLIQSYQKPSRSPKVAFSYVEVRSFPIILGDNPACSGSGPPLEIDWNPVGSRKVQIDEYEHEKRTRGIKNAEELKIGGFFRHVLLRRSGMFTNEEILSRMEEMEKVRRQRNKTKFVWLILFRIKNFFFW